MKIIFSREEVVAIIKDAALAYIDEAVSLKDIKVIEADMLPVFGVAVEIKNIVMLEDENETRSEV